MARRIAEVQEVEVEESVEVETEVNETENTYILSQKTKYNADDPKAYAFEVILDFTDVEIRELYNNSLVAKHNITVSFILFGIFYGIKILCRI
jgi:hypothetical protein